MTRSQALPRQWTDRWTGRWQLGAAWETKDRLRVMTLVAIGGLFVGAVMAVWGLPHADLHGPLHRYFGIMDPFCGGTRGVYYAMRWQWSRAWEYNPVSPMLVVGAALLVVRQVFGLVTGRWLTPRLRLPWPVTAAVSTVAVVVLEVNQQLHAALLLGP